MDSSSFAIAGVEEVETPAGGADGTWHRYVIDNGKAAITGYRRGTLEQVTRFALDLAQNINARAERGHTAWQSRQKK